ncbi:MAG TPA: class I SAM-dependent methyltransferase [Candidatus Binatia bacterium]|nr:class I SAM-dependent methyltransferase [Candidatus Binatia bacterium]
METNKKHRVCPVEEAGMLDHPLRRLYENPKRILRPFVSAGMAVLDFGCGPGFFTLEMARRVGPEGRVTTVDLQQGMLDKARAKLAQAGIADRVTFQLCRADAIGLAGVFDFILVFHVLHEVPGQAGFLRELQGLLKPQGRVLLAEPGFHVSRTEFQGSIDNMKQAGFEVGPGPRILFSRTVVLGTAQP